LIAIWPYIDEELVTQRDPNNPGLQMPNELDETASAPAFFSDEKNYHIKTQLVDGRLSLILDIGSPGNLGGDKWAKAVAMEAAKAGKQPSYVKRDRPLSVSGVGHGSQSAPYDCNLPIALKHANGNSISLGSITTPSVSDSDLPGLLGLIAMRKNRAILDLVDLKMYFVGPGDYDLEKALPPGTDCFQCELAPSGHMVVPCCEFDNATKRDDSTLSLVSKQKMEEPRCPPGLTPQFQ